MAKKESKSVYVITKTGVFLEGSKECQIGDEVKLTDEKALNLSGKVQSLTAYKSKGSNPKELESKISKLEKLVETLQVENEELKNALELATS